MIILGMMQVSKKIPFEDPQVLLGVRAMYIVSNLIILAIYLYIQQQINKKKGEPAPARLPYRPSAYQNTHRSDYSEIRGATANGLG